MAEKKNEIAVREDTLSERFSKSVLKQYAGEVGRVELTEHENTLIQHMFICCDAAFKEAEGKRTKQDNPPIVWANVNMEKLAIDTVHRVKLGLDALVPGHIYPIAYLNGKTKKYDIDLRIGYKGEEFYLLKSSLDPIRNIYLQLVYGNEKLVWHPKGRSNPVETYDLIPAEDPFDRGELRGGFAYIEYEDEIKNKLIIMPKAEFDKRRKLSGSDKFWGPYYDKMCLKTLVHEAANEIILDPEKVDITALHEVETEAIPVDGEIASANTGEEVTLGNADAPRLNGTPEQLPDFLRKPQQVGVVLDSAKGDPF